MENQSLKDNARDLTETIAEGGHAFDAAQSVTPAAPNFTIGIVTVNPARPTFDLGVAPQANVIQ